MSNFITQYQQECEDAAKLIFATIVRVMRCFLYRPYYKKQKQKLSESCKTSYISELISVAQNPIFASEHSSNFFTFRELHGLYDVLYMSASQVDIFNINLFTVSRVERCEKISAEWDSKDPMRVHKREILRLTALKLKCEQKIGHSCNLQAEIEDQFEALNELIIANAQKAIDDAIEAKKSIKLEAMRRYKLYSESNIKYHTIAIEHFREIYEDNSKYEESRDRAIKMIMENADDTYSKSAKQKNDGFVRMMEPFIIKKMIDDCGSHIKTSPRIITNLDAKCYNSERYYYNQMIDAIEKADNAIHRAQERIDIFAENFWFYGKNPIDVERELYEQSLQKVAQIPTQEFAEEIGIKEFAEEVIEKAVKEAVKRVDESYLERYDKRFKYLVKAVKYSCHVDSIEPNLNWLLSDDIHLPYRQYHVNSNFAIEMLDNHRIKFNNSGIRDEKKIVEFYQIFVEIFHSLMDEPTKPNHTNSRYTYIKHLMYLHKNWFIDLSQKEIDKLNAYIDSNLKFEQF